MAENVRLIVNIQQAELLFAKLDFNKQKNVLRAAVRKAISPVQTEAKANFKKEFNSITGEGYKSLGYMTYRRKIGIATGARIKAPYKGYYARFLDLGTDERYRKVNGKYVSTGKIKPSLFFNSAASAKEGQAITDLQDAVIFALNKAINKGSI